MSFNIYVPCNCRKNEEMKLPPFIDKLEIIDGLFQIRKEYAKNKAFAEELSRWNFCKHRQIAIEMDMSNSIISFRKFLNENYNGQFTNFYSFIPEANQWSNSNYDKNKAIKEIETFNQLEKAKFESRLMQFIQLLETAIAMETEIYWI